jgi:hypothetical protein
MSHFDAQQEHQQGFSLSKKYNVNLVNKNMLVKTR